MKPVDVIPAGAQARRLEGLGVVVLQPPGVSLLGAEKTNCVAVHPVGLHLAPRRRLRRDDYPDRCVLDSR